MFHKFLHTLIIAFFVTLLSVGWLAGHSSTKPCSVLPDGFEVMDGQRQVYPYRMKGKVRLIFFWVGKDGVGGGHITTVRQPQSDQGKWAEGVEVLFGSNPERVPGRVNRWGYGREWAVWQADGQNGRTTMQRSIFEGFMRKSDEESISEVQKKARARQEGELFVYEGIRSLVEPHKAASQVWLFSGSEDFDYRQPDALNCEFRRQMQTGTPDRRRDLENGPSSYSDPVGFLTSIRQVIDLVVGSQGRLKARQIPSRNYVYHARLYALSVNKVKKHRKFELPLVNAEGKEAGKRRFTDVAEVRFKVKRRDNGEDHSFALWFPLRGDLKGIPLRIVDQPRWWLKVELNLEPNRIVVSSAAPATETQND